MNNPTAYEQDQPVLETVRLILRPFTLKDAPRVRDLADDRDLADTLSELPHPYSEADAVQWLSTHRENWETQSKADFAVILKETHQIIGCVGLMLKGRRLSNAAEMGYWVGKPYWNQGYCSEAAAAVIAFAFNTLRLNRVSATCFARNAASARVLEKLGFKNEGRLRQAIMKWGQYEDAFVYGLLKSEWNPLVP